MKISSIVEGHTYIYDDGYASKKDFEFLKYIINGADYMKNKYKAGNICFHSYKSDLPTQKGFASSAAICLSIVEAYNLVFNLELSCEEKMRCAFEIERQSGSNCGRTDQFILYGTGIRHLHFFGENAEKEEIETNVFSNVLVVILPHKKNVAEIMRSLQKCYPVAQSEREKRMQDALGYKNHMLILRAVEAMRSNNKKLTANYILEAQEMFDKNITNEFSEDLIAPVAHSVLNDSFVKKYSLGGKINSQGDCSLFLVCENEADSSILKEYIIKKLGLICFELNL